MKKTSKKKKNIFLRIIGIFDKIIITPITKLIIKTGDFFKNNGKIFEKLFTYKQSLIVISLICAFAIFYTVDQKTTTLIDNSAEVLYGQPIKVEYNEELYVVEGIPKTADVTLIGRKWDVYLAKQYPADGVVVNLKGLKEGTHRVSAQYEKSVMSVDYKIDPSTITVEIYKKMSANRELSFDVLHKEVLDSTLNIDSVSLSQDNIIIKGAEYKLEKVALVKALIDVKEITNPKVGSISLKNVPLIAYDIDGNKVDVEIVPDKVDATIKIASPSKTVPIKIETEGELDNKAIKSLNLSTSTVTIYGASDALEKIDAITAKIDINGEKSNKKYTVSLVKPTGVRSMSVEKVDVSMVVDDITSKEIKNVKINTVNLGSGLKVQASSESDSSITVIVSGSESVIKNLDANSINAYVDLNGLSQGEHEVEIKISGEDNRAAYKSRVKKVKIKITQK